MNLIAECLRFYILKQEKADSDISVCGVDRIFEKKARGEETVPLQL